MKRYLDFISKVQCKSISHVTLWVTSKDASISGGWRGIIY